MTDVGSDYGDDASGTITITIIIIAGGVFSINRTMVIVTDMRTMEAITTW